MVVRKLPRKVGENYYSFFSLVVSFSHFVFFGLGSSSKVKKGHPCDGDLLYLTVYNMNR